MNRDLQSRIANDVADYADLIVRRASKPKETRDGSAAEKAAPANNQ